jgi:hypothetical protein
MSRQILVRLVFHPRSADARALASALYRELNEDPDLPGLHVAVEVLPEDGSDWPPARYHLDGTPSAVVLLADDQMVIERDVPAGRRSWAELAVELHRACASGKHRFLPVQLSEAAWPLDPALEKVNFMRAFAQPVAERTAWLARRLVIELYRFLIGVERGDRAPITLFLSHAKHDIGPGTPFNAMVEHLTATQPIKAWIDSGQIEAGGDFARAIEDGVRASDSVVSLLTSHYSQRPWCRREVMFAKKFHRAMVVADCLDGIDRRLYAYLGNVPTIAWEKGPARVIDLLLKETLQRQLVQRALDARKRPDEVALASAPELITTVGLARGTHVLYPDPPLPDDEVEALAPLGLELETPLERAGRDRSLVKRKIAISISEADDRERFGVLEHDVDAALLEVSRHLLVRGATLAYGGHLGKDGFTMKLFELVLAHQAEGMPPVERLLSYLGWPAPLTDAERAKYRATAKLIRVPRPDGVEALDPALFVADPQKPFGATTPERRYAWARGMTAFREQQTADIDARVVIGGSVGPTDKRQPDGTLEKAWYLSRIPGVLEEALLTLQAHKPLYVCAGFGGAGAVLVELLEGGAPARFTWEFHKQANHAEGMRALYEKQGVAWWDYPQMSEYVRGLGMAGLSAVNKLSVDENRELAATRDVDRIVELILEGLGRVQR